jgi:hypothetical protein
MEVREDKMKITQKIYDVSTGEETIIEREETAEETKARLDAQEKAKAYADAAIKAQAEKAVILARLGLTEEELQTILG